MEKIKINASRIYVHPDFKKRLKMQAVEETGGNVIELTRKLSDNNNIMDGFKPKKNKNGFKMYF